MIAAAVLAVLAATVPESPGGIPNYTVVRADLATAGAPDLAAVGNLASLGFCTVVNLKVDEEDFAREERAVVERQGLRYVSVPITPATFSEADARAVGKVLDDPAAGPVLLHCSTANRAGAVLAVLALLRGAPLEDALDEGRAAGLKGSAMVDAVRRIAKEREGAAAPSR